MGTTYARYFSNPTPTASARSPKQDRMGGLTLRCSCVLCRSCSSWYTMESQKGRILASSARHRSPTTPTVTLHTSYSSWFFSPTSMKGYSAVMYFSNPSPVAYASAPTASMASSCTVAERAASTRSSTCMMLSANCSTRFLDASPPPLIFWMMVCSVPHSSPCTSPSFSFWSADVPGAAMASRVRPSFCMTSGMSCCTMGYVSGVDARMISFSDS
mmetsp:Transcript_19167/g.47892  ORF Transcript_19167/g.47892 Transcript_19167/m.47892 type:complete len:215 (-) Transcript_19167:1028-1672(-)